MSKLNIAPATYDAIMYNALRTFHREDWLGQSPIEDARSDFIEQKFSSFCDRLIDASTFNKTPENLKNARKMFFAKFTEMALQVKLFNQSKN